MVLADTFERWNAIVAVLAKDANHLDQIINTLTRPMKNKVVEMQVTTRLRCHYGSTCILNPSYQVIKSAPVTPPPVARMDEKDLKIIHLLATDARMSARKIGGFVGLSPSTVQSRIARLEENKVIVGYRAIYDYSQLGYFVSRLLFRLAEPASTITNQITKELFRTGMVNIVARHLGFADLDARCFALSINDLSTLISGIRDKFVDDILRVEIVPILRWQFVNHLPIEEIEGVL
ncbi:MAG: AsnC family transcriptional regulator, partial [Bdellovibrionales bacterium]|nr:AsnC family transcriptional regulator [Bdellovibrionales bacterium]